MCVAKCLERLYVDVFGRISLTLSMQMCLYFNGGCMAALWVKNVVMYNHNYHMALLIQHGASPYKDITDILIYFTISV